MKARLGCTSPVKISIFHIFISENVVQREISFFHLHLEGFIFTKWYDSDSFITSVKPFYAFVITYVILSPSHSDVSQHEGLHLHLQKPLYVTEPLTHAKMERQTKPKMHLSGLEVDWRSWQWR
ncbi:hypothetical protein BDZ45DRAFT_281798 [Acephala macrosclerotiorum]|nr:hypothetical protein BDZ45DRAFT_281798 [Acephala macrosclerotiorum]